MRSSPRRGTAADTASATTVGPERPTGWTGHVWAARLVQVFIVAGPIAIGVAASFVFARVLPTPTSTLVRWAQIVVVAGGGVVVMRGARRATQRLLPLSALLRLTLTFGDSTPSRMRVAMRMTSEARLRQIAEETRVDGLPTEPTLAAERILELVAALSYHDWITRGHAERVRAYCGLIATELHLDASDQERLKWAGLLHDIGKLGVPTSILNKPGRLTDEEFDVIKTHPGEGERLLEPVRPWLGDVVDAAGQHHERWDGKGYPRGLAGEEIVLSARVVSVADVFDVMTSTRSYKEPATPAEARIEIASCAGTQLDATVVRAFLAIPLSRLRRAMGPLTLLAEIPAMAALPAVGSAAAATVGALGTAAVAAVASLASVTPPTSSHPVRTPTAVVSTVSGDVGSAPSGATSGGATPVGGTPGAESPGIVATPGEPTADAASGSPESPLGFVSDETGAPAAGESPGTTLPGSPSVTTPTGGTVPTTTPRVSVPVTTPTVTVPVTTPTVTTPTVTVPSTTPTVTVPSTTPTVTVPSTTPTVTVPITTTTITVPITTTTITVPITTPTITLPIPTL